MKTMLTILSVSWKVMRNVPVVIRCFPMIADIINKAVAMFGSDKAQEFFKAIGRLFDSPSPADTPVPNIGDTEEDRQRRQFLRFRNRVGAVCALTDEEAQEICDKRNIQHDEIA